MGVRPITLIPVRTIYPEDVMLVEDSSPLLASGQISAAEPVETPTVEGQIVQESKPVIPVPVEAKSHVQQSGNLDEFVYQVRDPRKAEFSRIAGDQAYSRTQALTNNNSYDVDSIYNTDKLGYYKRQILA